MNVMELKPCPACRGDAEHIHIYAGEEMIRCASQCRDGPWVSGESVEQVARYWNALKREGDRA
jgi:hypothetical protein